MSFVSIEFIGFVLISIILYYILPLKFRWIALLLSSYSFYLIGGGKTIIYLLFTTLTTYTSGLLIGKLNIKNALAKQDKNASLQSTIKIKKRILVAFSCVSNFGLLFYFKYWNFTATSINTYANSNIFPTFNIVLPLAISFYMFQAIGYVIDVYRNKYLPETNVFKFALFVSFFPQMVQGPISRFGSNGQLAPLGKQLSEGNKFSFDNIKPGIQLIMWGYLKKLIIADRAAVIVNTVFNNYLEYDGGTIVVGVILYCIQLYCDFSGGIDITRGIAKLFGIDLIDNFKRPIFATSLADFWRRWHISLGAWMKDYLFYPLSLSKPFIKLGKFIRKHIGGKAGKIIPVSIVTFIVYFVIGIWHGASVKYIAFGFWNGGIITISLLLENFFIKLKNILHINNSNPLYKAFAIIRTSIIVLIGRYITRAAGFRIGLSMLKRTVVNFSFSGLREGILLSFGLSHTDLVVIAIGTFVLLIVEYFQEKNKSLSAFLDKKGFFLQWIVMFSAILVLLLFGIFRGDYISSEFIYKQF